VHTATHITLNLDEDMLMQQRTSLVASSATISKVTHQWEAEEDEAGDMLQEEQDEGTRPLLAVDITRRTMMTKMLTTKGRGLQGLTAPPRHRMYTLDSST